MQHVHEQNLGGQTRPPSIAGCVDWRGRANAVGKLRQRLSLLGHECANVSNGLPLPVVERLGIGRCVVWCKRQDELPQLQLQALHDRERERHGRRGLAKAPQPCPQLLTGSNKIRLWLTLQYA